MKSFSDACRLMEPLQLVVEAAGEPDVGIRMLHQPFALIGRDPRADVPLEHRLVSRRHAYLQVVEGYAFWIDLESRLGTMGGGRPRKYGWLTHDESMRIGPYELRRPARGRILAKEDRIPESVPLISKTYGTSPWPVAGLEFLNGPSRGSVWPMNRVLSLVGSAAGCKFRLADPSVSPFHCSLVRTQAGLWVVDLLGGGVEVNKAPVRYALLDHGDILSVGRYRIRIQSRISSEGALNDDEDDLERSTSRSLSLVRRPSVSVEVVPTSFDGGTSPPVLQSVTVLPAELPTGTQGDSAAVLVPIMNQFGIMQQQMLDQFQNAMGMLVQMFGSLQREQMELIRQELDQLREVTQEFQSVKAELAAYTSRRVAEEAVATSAAEVRRSSPPPPASVETPPSLSVPGPRPSADVRRPRFASRPQPTEPAPVPVDSNIPATPSGDVLVADAPPIPEQTPASDAAATAERSGVRPATAAGPPPGGSEGDVLLWLNRRINTLQEERESRWQKILRLLPGSS